MKTEDMKKSELITDVYRAKRVYEAEMKTPEYRAENEEDFEFIGKALFARGYRKAPEVARELIEDIATLLEANWKDIQHGSHWLTNGRCMPLRELLKNVEKKYTEGKNDN